MKHTKRILVRRETFERISLIGAGDDENEKSQIRCPQCGAQISRAALSAWCENNESLLNEASGDDSPNKPNS